MLFKISTLWQAPVINPVNNKAQSIPVFNPFNIYGRVFLMSWWSFFIAFWSWYAFPPLLTVTIAEDLHLTQNQIANSNILALTVTFLVRLGAGAACDRIGPRCTFAAILIAGAIPTALAGTVNNAAGLLVLRCFIGILGGSFVPCQVWTTGFFDKNVVGTANALAAGLGISGSGVTYFLMPVIFDSLVEHRHLTPHKAWRVVFVVPFILLSFTALIILLICPDVPTGKWSSRAYDMQRQTEARDLYVSQFGDFTPAISPIKAQRRRSTGKRRPLGQSVKMQGGHLNGNGHCKNDQADVNMDDVLNAASWELIEKPSYRGSIKAVLSLPTLTLIVVYFCTFGTELSVNSFLGAYYLKNFPNLGQTGSGRWAAMYGLLNAIFRPMGGIIADIIYKATGSLWGKKLLIHSLGIVTGAFMLIIGILDSKHKSSMIGLMTGLAFFEEAGNGSVFALLPHAHPTSNGEFAARVMSLACALVLVEIKCLLTMYVVCRPCHGGCGCCRRHGRYRVSLDCEIPGYELWESVLDPGNHQYCGKPVRCMDSSNTEGAAGPAVRARTSLKMVGGIRSTILSF